MSRGEEMTVTTVLFPLIIFQV